MLYNYKCESVSHKDNVNGYCFSTNKHGRSSLIKTSNSSAKYPCFYDKRLTDFEIKGKITLERYSNISNKMAVSK